MDSSESWYLYNTEYTDADETYIKIVKVVNFMYVYLLQRKRKDNINKGQR